jgi:hypothetical protein
MKQRFNVMVAALWWGSLTGLGFVVVPMLFANLGRTRCGRRHGGQALYRANMAEHRLRHAVAAGS